MRLLIVSNRLHYTIVEKEGKLVPQESVGGLASGIKSYLESLKNSSLGKIEYLWVGWPGITVSAKNKNELLTTLAELNAYPVLISETAMENFYNGFCNKTLWPLFHYFPSYVTYDNNYWLYYENVNEAFCYEIIKIIKPGDVVWIHDYHLMLLPKLLREKIEDLPIGFFLHIPFPSFEIFRLLPSKWRRRILQGLMGADFIGFHTHDYAQHFLTCVLRILGYEHNLGVITTENRVTKVDTFPMGIDFKKFNDSINNNDIQKKIKELKEYVGNRKTIISIDRLDYTKGIINRLLGFELFLNKNPEWHEKVILILVVVPSRIGVYHYQQMKKRIDELVGEINGKFGNINWVPILYQYKFLPFNELIPYYNISDVALITPLRDGMNLIAKEYIASRTDCTGVLILSEMAGASKELGEAIIINPNNNEEIADALKEALDMPNEEQIRRIQIMQKRLARYNVIRWADDFVKNLISVKEDQKKFESRLLDNYKQKLIMDFKNAKKRLIFLDYDGTLVPFSIDPKMVNPDKELIKILRALSENEKNEVVLISGRDKDTIQNWFSSLNIGLVAEHGAWIKEKNENWKTIKPMKNDWKSKILPILEIYADSLPGSFIEEKEFSIVWHYRGADSEHSALRTKELLDYLVTFTANMDIQILQGNKVIEIKNSGINKGLAGMQIMAKNNFDFICAIGDDWTDEDLFIVLPESAYSIRIGVTQSNAKFNVHNYKEIRQLLEELKGLDK